MKSTVWAKGMIGMIGMIALSSVVMSGLAAAAQSEPTELPAVRVYAPAEPGLTWDHPVTVVVPAEAVGPRGTLAIWFRPADALRGPGKSLTLFDSEALAATIKRTSASTNIGISFGPAMTGPAPNGKNQPYTARVLLTHLKKDRWYHAAWTWAARRSEAPQFFLDGVRQVNLASLNYPGQIQGADRVVSFRLGGKGLTVSALYLSTTPMTGAQLTAWCRTPGHPGYTDEGIQYRKQRFIPEDVDWKHPIYATRFEEPAVLKDWRLEGGQRMTVAGGHLVLESDPTSSRSDPEPNHLVCWLTREIPADFLLEFGVRPQDRRRGLNIVFFNARGLNGESIFAPSLHARNGLFPQYHSGDINNYHISYWTGGRGTSNLRKNRGFHLAAIGQERVENAPADRFQTIRVYKRGGMIRLTVDGRLALSYDDDGMTLGPVHTHSGWVGFRQMVHTQRCEYDHLAAYPLLSPPAASSPTSEGRLPGVVPLPEIWRLALK